MINKEFKKVELLKGLRVERLFNKKFPLLWERVRVRADYTNIRQISAPTSVLPLKGGSRAAFTLAEVLITLGVIGVVASLTMPSLIQKTEEQRTVAQLSKVYSTISQAWQQMETEYGPIDTWGMTSTSGSDFSANKLISERLQQYLKVSKRCKVGEICHTTDKYNLNGDLNNYGNIAIANEYKEAAYAFYLADGTIINFGWYNSYENKIDIYVDLPAKKRIMGKTTFYFRAFPYKIIPDGNSEERFEDSCKPTGTDTNVGRACTAWVLYNKNMDYLHCPEELSWSGKTKCD